MDKIFKKIRKDLEILEVNSRDLALVISLVLFVSLFDLIGLSLIAPLIDITINSNGVNKYLETVNSFGIEITEQSLVFYMPILVLSVFVIKFMFIYFANYRIFQFSENIRKNLRVRLMSYYLMMNYLDFIKKNTSTTLFNSTEAVGIVSTKLIYVSLKILSEAIIALTILSFLFISYPQLFALIFTLVFIASTVYFLIFGRRSRFLGKKSNKLSENLTKISLQLLEGFKELNIRNLTKNFLDNLASSASEFAKIRAKADLYSGMPKYYFELVFFGLFCTLLIYFSIGNNGTASDFVASIGVFGVAFIRLLPIAATILGSAMQFEFGLDAYKRIIIDLKKSREQNRSEPSKLSSEFKSISLSNINFGYTKELKLFSNLNLEIKKGDFVVIKGESGSGKSTLVEIICKLIPPDSGEIKFNNKAIKQSDIHSHFSYSPQKTFIFEGSLKENISLDDKNIDEDKFKEILEIAQLKQLYIKVGDEDIGESGSKISGGQMQRISIARALYSNKSVLIFDETTNALDIDLERKIIEGIKVYANKNEKTIIFISHGNIAPEFSTLCINLNNE